MNLGASMLREQFHRLGYRPRKLWTPTAGFPVPGIRAVCSASNCLTSKVVPDEPEWDRLNEMGCYLAMVAAIDAARRAGASDFEVHSFHLYPQLFTKDGPKTLAITGTIDAKEPGGAAPTTPTRLGFDVINVHPAPTTLEASSVNFLSFGCSPLSCNMLGQEVPVNEFCLIEDLNTAIRAAERFAREEPEPGPYIIVEIARCNGSL